MSTTITGLHLRGFKSFDTIELPLDPLSVLIGANGTGKSNFLSFLRLLGAIAGGGFQQFAARQGGASSLLHHGSKQTRNLEFRVHLSMNGQPGQYSARLDHGAPDRLDFAREAIERGEHEWQMQHQVASAESGLGELSRRDTHGLVAGTLASLKRIRVYHFHDTSDTAAVKQTADLNDNQSLRGDAGNHASSTRYSCSTDKVILLI